MIAIALWDWFTSRRRLEAEILVLRHQLNILQQRAPRRLHLRWVSELLDNCRDARHGRPEKPAPVFDKKAFLEAVENAEKLNLQCAELTRQLRTTRQSVASLKAFGGSPLPKRPEGD